MRFTQAQQIRLCGNSVPPQFAAALARANCAEMAGQGVAVGAD